MKDKKYHKYTIQELKKELFKLIYDRFENDENVIHVFGDGSKDEGEETGENRVIIDFWNEQIFEFFVYESPYSKFKDRRYLRAAQASYVKPSPWMPKEGEEYWFIEHTGMVSEGVWKNLNINTQSEIIKLLKFGNVFQTEAIAIYYRDRIQDLIGISGDKNAIRYISDNKQNETQTLSSYRTI